MALMSGSENIMSYEGIDKLTLSECLSLFVNRKQIQFTKEDFSP
jgi:hypothetical protein